MFSSNSIINLLFANPDDTYYTEGLCQFTDLNRYIWYLLHRHNCCDIVYFMQREGSGIRISSFGDRDSKIFTGKKGFLRSYATSFREWMVSRLQERTRRCVIVCSMKDFCELTEDADYVELLEELIKLGQPSSRRSGFILLTASSYVMDSKKYLLEGKSFSKRKIGDTDVCLCDGILSIRRETHNIIHTNIYDMLAGQMGDACVFLNRLDKSALRAIVTNLVIREEMECSDIERMVQHLYVVLNSKQFYTGQILRNLTNGGSLKRKDLYTKLLDASVYSSVKNAYDPLSTEVWDRVPIFYENHIMMNCLRLQWPKELASCENGGKLLADMKRSLLQIPNQELNTKILDILECVYTRYIEICMNRNIDIDEQILCFLLTAMGYYAKWLYVEKDSAYETEMIALSERVNAYTEGYISYMNQMKAAANNTIPDLEKTALMLQELYMTREQEQQQQSKEKLDTIRVMIIDNFKKISAEENALEKIKHINLDPGGELAVCDHKDTDSTEKSSENNEVSVKKQSVRPEFTADMFTITPKTSYRAPKHN